MTTWNQVADEATIKTTMAALEANGIKTSLVPTGAEAKTKVFELIPQGAQVFNMTSVTLDTLGIAKEILESGKYEAVRAKLNDPATPPEVKRHLGAAPDWALGSVHAVTHNGSVVIASRTGSQLPAYAYGAAHVIWVVGTQKIVTDLEAANQRIYDYVLPLESERANKAYGGTGGSHVSKLLTIHREIQKDRIHLIFVNEALGF